MTGGGGGDPAAGDAAARWVRVEAVLAAALGCTGPERDALLDVECAGDPALRHEVETLLAACERSGVFDALAASVAPLATRLLEPPGAPLAGRTVGRYTVRQLVAHGGMGVVHCATDERLGRTVALKFLRPRSGADHQAAERFAQEARAVAALEHPNICTVHEIGETADGQLYLAMPLYAGETLQQRVARGPVAAAEAVGIAVQVARGLAKAHGRGLVHRDVKPSNVFLTDDGVVKLLDFGIATLSGAAQADAAAGPLGTVAYMSPEQLRNEPVDARTDVWSLGVVLYEMLTGSRPFRGATAAAIAAAIQRGQPAPPDTLRRGVSASLGRVVMRALSATRDARYPSAHAMERDLLAFGVGRDLPAAASPSHHGAWRGHGRRLATAIALAVPLFGVAIALRSAVQPAPRPSGGTASPVAAGRGTRDPQAYELYRRGRFLWLRRTREGQVQAEAYFRRAIARDAAYADAYAGLADTYLTSRRLGFSNRSEAEAQAGHDSAAARALALDRNSSAAHTAWALALWWRRDWPGAEREMQRAIALDPANTTARGWYLLLLAGTGRVDEAVREGRRAYAEEPFALVVSVNYAWSCYVARRYACAIDEYRRSMEIDSTFAQAPGQLSIIYSLEGRHADALAMAARAVELAPGNAAYLADLAYVHAAAGHRAEAYRLLERARTTMNNGFHLGMAFVALGEADSAFAYLARSTWLWPYAAVRADPALDPIRGDPRFARLSGAVDRELGLR